MIVFTLKDSMQSTLLKNKFSYYDIKDLKRNKEYYEKNQIINRWLKWEKPNKKKVMFAITLGFENYALMNLDILHILVEDDNLALAYNLGFGCSIEFLNWFTNKCTTDFFIFLNWNSGLAGACEGGNMEKVEFMIAKGATDWNCGLAQACKCGNMEIIKLMIAKGATDCKYVWL